MFVLCKACGHRSGAGTPRALGCVRVPFSAQYFSARRGTPRDGAQSKGLMNSHKLFYVTLALAGLSAGCVGSGPNTEQGAVGGAAAGAILGGIVGNNSRHGSTLGGAAIAGTPQSEIESARVDTNVVRAIRMRVSPDHFP